MDGTEFATLNELVNFTLEYTATHMNRGFTVTEQELNVMCMFRYAANDSSQL